MEIRSSTCLRRQVREGLRLDLDQVKCIKDEKGKVLMEEILIKKRWLAYFHKLLNKEEDIFIVLGELENSERHWVFGYCRHIKVEEVKCDIRRMTKGKATVPYDVPIEFWKNVDRKG